MYLAVPALAGLFLGGGAVPRGRRGSADVGRQSYSAVWSDAG